LRRPPADDERRESCHLAAALEEFPSGETPEQECPAHDFEIVVTECCSGLEIRAEHLKGRLWDHGRLTVKSHGATIADYIT